MENKYDIKNSNKKISTSIVSVLIIASLYVPIILSIFGVDSPNHSKQNLAPLPKLSMTKNFPSEFDLWWQDHFPGRSLLVTSNAILQAKIFNTSINDKVLVGNDNWYFFAETVPQYQNIRELSDNDLARITRSLEMQANYVESKGAEFHVYLIPNKASIYPEFLPKRIKKYNNKSDLERFLELNPNYINLKSILKDAKNIEDDILYHKEDSHWNRLGTKYVYEAILKDMKVPNKIVEYSNHVITDKWEGDLSNMLYPAIVVSDNQVKYPNYEKQFAFTRRLRSREDIEIESRGLANQEGNVLMFRDSFANLLMDFFSNSFNKVHYSRVLPYRYELLDSFEADHVVIELVERNLDYLHQSAVKLPLNYLDSFVFEYENSGKLLVDYSNDKTNRMHYFDFVDQKFGAKITRVILSDKSGSSFFEALPITNDENIQDGLWNYGFSYHHDGDNFATFAYLYSEDDSVWTKYTLDYKS